MRSYNVIAPLTLPAGIVLGLSKAQAVARAHALKPVTVDKKTGAGTFETIASTQFKVGETIATEATLNKQLAELLESVEDTAARLKADEQAKADAANLDAVRAKAKQWDDVQEELTALRQFVQDMEALPKQLLDQVKAELAKKK